VTAGRNPSPPIPWGSVPRRMAEAGVLQDAFGRFRMVAADCPACGKQWAICAPVGAATLCSCGTAIGPPERAPRR
jgi:hypothetical protein